jgi:hypothetical protein
MNLWFWLKKTKCKKAGKITAKMGFPRDPARRDAANAKDG